MRKPNSAQKMPLHRFQYLYSSRPEFVAHDVHALDAVSAKFLYIKNERKPFEFGPRNLSSGYLKIVFLKMPTFLDHLRATGTVVVSDSGDFECKIVPCITNW